MDHIRGAIIKVKRRLNDPYIVISEDFNQWEVQGYLEDFPDLGEIMVGPSRGDRCIDRSFGNLWRSVTACGSIDPLEVDCMEDGTPSE